MMFPSLSILINFKMIVPDKPLSGDELFDFVSFNESSSKDLKDIKKLIDERGLQKAKSQMFLLTSSDDQEDAAKLLCNAYMEHDELIEAAFLISLLSITDLRDVCNKILNTYLDSKNLDGAQNFLSSVARRCSGDFLDDMLSKTFKAALKENQLVIANDVIREMSPSR